MLTIILYFFALVFLMSPTHADKEFKAKNWGKLGDS